MPTEELWEGTWKVSGMHPTWCTWGAVGLGVWPGWGRASPKLLSYHLCSLQEAEPEQSDGKEDFHYTELYAGMDMLSDGLFSQTPVSHIVSMLLTFPHLELPELLEPLAFPNLLQRLTLSLPPKLSSSQASHSDHAYQPSETTDRD